MRVVRLAAAAVLACAVVPAAAFAPLQPVQVRGGRGRLRRSRPHSSTLWRLTGKPCRPHLRALIDQQQLRRAGGSSCAVRMAGFGAKSGAKDSKVGSAFRPAPASPTAAAAQSRACAADAGVRICAFPQP